MKNVCWLIFTLIFLGACSPQEEEKRPESSDAGVNIRTDGIFEPMKVESDSPEFMGNFLVGMDPLIVTFTLTNQSNFSLTNVDLEIDEVISASMTFVKDEDGQAEFPGVGGTCAREIPAKSSCTVRVIYTPALPGEQTQLFTFKFTNLAKSDTIQKSLSARAGEPASLIFTNDTSNYHLGIVERTFQDDLYTQELVIENRGGLPATDLNLLIENVPNSGAFRIIENDCPSVLEVLASCRVLVEFSTQNFGPGAPDGDTDRLNYSTTVRFEYVKDPLGSPASLNARIQALATTIEARLERGGLADIRFNELVVGNTHTRTFRIVNNGFKEAIVRSIHVTNASDTRVATCVSIGSEYLSCRDPNDHLNPSAQLSLAQLPFRIRDNTACLSTNLTYTRDPNGELSDPSIRTVPGQTLNTPGETCFFDLMFHPSVEYLADGNFNDYGLIFEYDSTWKNGIVLYGDSALEARYFNVAEANYRAAAVLQNAQLTFNGASITQSLTQPELWRYELGRIALISNPSYLSSLSFDLRNVGGAEAQIQSIVDGKGRTVTASNQNFDSYYRNVNHSNCNTLVRSTGACNVRMQLTPLASTNPNPATAQANENNLMFDVVGGDSYKSFTVTYADGSTLNDDLTPRDPKVIQVRFSALLVRKGFLVYSTQNDASGSIGSVVTRNETEFSFAITNVGTGSIPYMSFTAGRDLSGSNAKAQGNAFPFEVIAKNPADVLADSGLNVQYDCSTLFTDWSLGQPAAISPGLAPGLLGAGESCAFTVRSKLRTTDVKPLVNYTEYLITGEIDRFGSDWRRSIYLDALNPMIPDSHDWQLLSDGAYTTGVRIFYYDGDGVSDPVNGYTADLEGYGNYFRIGVAGTTDYEMNVVFREPASLVPSLPRPTPSAVLYRPSATLPLLPVDGWGDPVDAFVLNEMWRWFGDVDQPQISLATAGYFSVNQVPVEPTSNYTFHAGTFPAGGIYDLSFVIENEGQTSATIRSHSLIDNSGHSSLSAVDLTLDTLPDSSQGILIPAGSTHQLQFLFSPETGEEGLHSADYFFTYENGVTGQSVTKVITVLVNVTDNSHGQPLVEFLNWRVDFEDPIYTETLLGGPTPVAASFNSQPDINNTLEFTAVRGGAIYEKRTIVLTNPHASPIREVNFLIKATAESTAIQNANGGGVTGYRFTNNSCNNVTLNQGESCTLDVIFSAASGEPTLNDRVGVFSYRWDTPSQFVNTNFGLRFNAVDPATLFVAGINPKTVLDSVGTNIPRVYPILLGNISNYQSSTHPVLQSFPSTFGLNSTILITNIAETKASFLAQYRNFVGDQNAEIPPGEWITVYNERRLAIEMNRACFYGDDEDDPAVENDKKGFQNGSVLECRMRPTYTAGDEYLSQRIPSGDNIHTLQFYNNLRSSTSIIRFVVEGFIEANPVARASSVYSNPVTNESGELYFEWEPMSVSNPAWGPIVGYRVFYSNIVSAIERPFTTNNIPFVDSFELAAPNVTISGLTPNRKYHVRVLALRSTGSKTYVARDRAWGRLDFVVPDVDHFYDFPTNSLITKRFAPEGESVFQGTLNGAINWCSSRRLTVSRNGANIQVPYVLVTQSHYNAIAANEANTIADRPLSILPHWIRNSNTNIVPIFGPESETSLQGNLDLDFYIKPCTTCNILPYIEGSDGEEFPPNSRIYVDGDNFTALARCYVARP